MLNAAIAIGSALGSPIGSVIGPNVPLRVQSHHKTARKSHKVRQQAIYDP